MADKRISELTPGGPSALGALYVFEGGGANFSTTKGEIHTGPPGDPIYLRGSPGQEAGLETDSGMATIILQDDGTLVLESQGEMTLGDSAADSFLKKLALLSWQLTFPDGQGFFVNSVSNNTNMALDDGTGQIFLNAVNGCIVSYVPANPADWSGSAPLTHAEAIDRIAAMLGPIT